MEAGSPCLSPSCKLGSQYASADFCFLMADHMLMRQRCSHGFQAVD